MRPIAMLLQALCLCALLPIAEFAQAANWDDALRQEIERIDRESPGSLGVYVKRLSDGASFNYNADKLWYLSSTVKVPVAITVLKQVDAGKLKLGDKLVLQEGDKVDGSGALAWQQTGTSYPIDSLLKRMLRESDNTATNLLIRTVGLDNLNRTASDIMGSDVRKLTDMAEVRYDVYEQMHPDARKLSHLQLVQIAAAPLGPQRVENVRRNLNLPKEQLQAKTIDEAYARYYRTEVNSATLEAYGKMLEQLVRGKLLSPRNTRVLFTDMSFDSLGDYRLQGGLPRNVKFIHKTGTQYKRACHMGVINPQDDGRHAVVVTTCAADLDENKEAGGIFQRVGRAVSKAALPGS
ncbi:MAG: serine hydrolase [Pseudomonadota bacterium]